MKFSLLLFFVLIASCSIFRLKEVEMGIYKNYSQLAEKEVLGQDYTIRSANRNSTYTIIAPHAGGIEPGTGEIVLDIAGTNFNYYLFSGIKETNNSVLHITSGKFDEPVALELVANSGYVIAIHGCKGDEEAVFIGGLDKNLVEIIADNLRMDGFFVRTDKYIEFPGKLPENICNRNRRGKGVQIELTEALRQTMFTDLSRIGRNEKTEVFYRFVNSVRRALGEGV
jgi:phage replication-related protein YjqB (UPF0714/DUF867 family)